MPPRIILLVEDNESDRELAKRALAKGGFALRELVIAEDGQEALDFLFGATSQADLNSRMPALVLLDLKLPRVAGLDVLRRIRDDHRTRRLPVVVLTTSGLGKDIEAAYDLGANSFVRKPVDFKEFTEAIRNLSHYWLTMNETPPEGHLTGLDATRQKASP